MNEEFKELAINSFYLYLIQGLNYLLPLIVLPYLLSILSSESFGIYVYAIAFSQFAILFVDFGFNISATKRIAQFENDLDKVKEVYWTITIIKLMFFIVVMLLTLFLVNTIEKFSVYKLGVLITYIAVFATVFFPIWWFQGLNKMKSLSIINGISKLVTYPFIFLFVKLSTDYVNALIIHSLSLVIAAVLSVIYIFSTHKNYFKISDFKFFTGFKMEIKEAWPIFLSNSAISLYTNGLTILLGVFSTAYYVGLFGAMERIVRVVCFGVLGPINQACFPVIVKLSKTNFNQAKKIFKYVLTGIFIVMTVICLLFFVFESVITKKFLSEYKNTEIIFRIFILTILPISLGGICGQLGLLALGDNIHKKVFSNIYIYIGLISIPISFTSIYFYNVYGAVFSMMLVETIIFILMFRYVKKFKFI